MVTANKKLHFKFSELFYRINDQESRQIADLEKSKVDGSTHITFKLSLLTLFLKKKEEHRNLDRVYIF